MNIVEKIEHEALKTDIPEFKAGDTLRIHQKIKEGDKQRIQIFEGVVIAKRVAGIRFSFTVRKNSYGVGVEKTFLAHSPLIEKIEFVYSGKVRREEEKIKELIPIVHIGPAHVKVKEVKLYGQDSLSNFKDFRVIK